MFSLLHPPPLKPRAGWAPRARTPGCQTYLRASDCTGSASILMMVHPNLDAHVACICGLPSCFPFTPALLP